MRLSIYILLILALTLAACGGSDDPTQQPVFASVTPVPSVAPGSFSSGTVTPTTQFIVPTSTTTTFLGATAVPGSSSSVGPVLPPSNCAVPTGWQPYIVAAGDTLAVIAASIGSTTDQLQTANCLTNPDAIYVGQTLYLPNLPAIVPTSIPTVAGATTTCAVPAGWLPYVVAAGDTLSLIAFSVNSSVLSLQNANCLTNPDALFVGQTIYLPALPASAGTVIFSTAVPTAGPIATTVSFPTATPPQNTAPVLTELLRISPTTMRADGTAVTTQRTVSLNVGVVATATTVRYFAGTSATDQNPVLVGIDNDPFNGTQINYTLSQFDNDLFFIAVAENEVGFTSSNIVHLVYDPTFSSNQGAPVVQPFTALNGTTYTLTANTTVSISWTQAPQDATRIEFYYQASSATTPQLIGTDTSPNNGALVSWLVPQSINGEVFARAVYAARTVDSQRISVVSGQ